MHALIVIAHPDKASLTHAVAAQLAEGIGEQGTGRTYEIADLMAEAFDPRFNAADMALFHRTSPPPADVAAEHARIDRADDLVLVYPVYWWSMPGLLKGWIDRVFTNGWAYDDTETGIVKKLRRLRVHLIGIGGADAGTYTRHGYFAAMKTQIDHGIFDYCGARVVTSELLLESDSTPSAPHLRDVLRIGRKLFDDARSTSAGAA